ncbi:TPA: tail fiber assembly protein [Stenotrophomonas maltophilia]|nr:phage tail assembly chaperone [Stenotrophomonas maltophilia]
MNADYYAVTDSGYRSVTADGPLAAGETKVTLLPQALLTKLKGEQMKSECSQRLRSTDWTQMADAPLSVEQKTAWAVYRRALRDMPALSGFPDVSWPSPPASDGAASGLPRATDAT